MDLLKENELHALLNVGVKDRSVEIGHFIAKHYGGDPTLVRLSDLLISQPKKATNSLHLEGVSDLDLWRDAMVASDVMVDGLSIKEAVNKQVDQENRYDPDAPVSEKSVRGSIARVRKARKVMEQKRILSGSQNSHK